MNMLKLASCLAVLFALIVSLAQVASAQQSLGAINGTVTDASGAVVQGVAIKARNVGTNLEVTAESKGDGSFNMADLPIGTYEVTFSKTGFRKEIYPRILVNGGLTATINAELKPGEVTATVTVNATPLLNQTDTSNGFTIGSELAQEIPLATGSFTQLAVLAPGVSADFLSGTGSNEGLGNQGIWANGQRDTSNTFTFNSVSANNLFNGNSTSNIAEGRFVLNTGEVFNSNGSVQTNTSVFDAIGEGLPTPPVETIQELHVTTSMYDASQGSTSGAHIELTTKSGTNQYHGQAYEYFQNNDFDAAPTFFISNPAAGVSPGAPGLHRNVFGGTLGGPIKKDKLFFFASAQGQRVADALNGAISGVPTIAGLTSSNRDAQDLANLVNFDEGLSPTLGGPCTSAGRVQCVTVGAGTANPIDPVSLALVQAKTKSGQFIIPSSNITNETPEEAFNALLSGGSSTFNAEQYIGDIDYNFSPKDRLAGKYYYQHNPSESPFAVSPVVGFPESLNAGSQVFSLDNTYIVSPNSTWEQRFGFIREIADAVTGQPFTPSSLGLTLPAGSRFPGINIENADAGALFEGSPNSALFADEMKIGPSTNFANAGIFQNQFEAASKYNWVLGKHTLSFGGNFDYTQLNVENRENNVALLTFNDLSDFITGTLGADRSSGTLLDGETNRHFRSKLVGLYAQDSYKVRPNLTVTAGLRFDWDGPLYETNGLMTNFNPKDYGYDLQTDSFNPVNGTPGIGLVVAGNNKVFGTKGESDSTLTGRQWMFAPRIGVAWSPSRLKNFVVRAGFGLYADRGEYFTELSESAGLGISGPFSVTTQEPFTLPLNTGAANIPGACPAPTNCLSNIPFGTVLPAPPTSLTGTNSVASLFPNLEQMAGCFGLATPPGLEQPNQPYCSPNSFSPPRSFLFGGYNPANKLPYSENWSLDLQWQPRNDLVLTLGYTGNHGVHLPVPIPFNQPGIATPTNPINNQIYSYGYLGVTPIAPKGCDSFFDNSPTCVQLPAEAVQTTVGDFAASDGNTALRTPFVGLNPNADSWTAAGISNYNALQFSVTKRMSHGLQLSASYTYSHSLDEGSGLGAGLFFNGNNPLNLRTSYANSDFERPHVFTISYLYQLPKIKDASRFVDAVANGWGISGITVAESGEPFSIIDFSGAAGGVFYSADDFVTNPILPLAPGVTPGQATVGYATGKNPPNPPAFINPNDFSIPLLAPGQLGVPPCENVTPQGGGAPVQVCDNLETGFGNNGRNIFRSPFQLRFDFSLFKNFKLSERFTLKLEADAFNLFNHPSFDTPNSDFELNSCFNPVPCYNTSPGVSKGFGVINETIGSPRLMQLQAHLNF
jgi:hypothetical protein